MGHRFTPDEQAPRPRRIPAGMELSLRRRRAAKRTVAVLPTLFTLGNLLSGFISVFFASRPTSTELPFLWTPLTFAAIFVFIGMVMDGLDGRIARMTRNTSDLGAQLDSMADMVTFGVAPAFMAVQLVGVNTPFLGISSRDLVFDRLSLAIGMIYVACAALRLARFNLELHKPSESDHSSFKGLPSPGAAGTVAGLVLLHQHFVAHRMPDHWSIRYSAMAMVAIMLLVAFAMVSRLRYVHLANRFLRGRVGIRKVANIVIVGLMLAVWPQESLALGFTLYALSAPAQWFWRIVTGKPAHSAPAAPALAPKSPQESADDSPTDKRQTG